MRRSLCLVVVNENHPALALALALPRRLLASSGPSSNLNPSKTKISKSVKRRRKVIVPSLEIDPASTSSSTLPSSLEDSDVPRWLQGKVPNGYWTDKSHRRLYMDWLGNRLGYKTPENWYGLTKYAFLRNKGNGIFAEFGSSPSKAVMETYTEHVWVPWLFSSSSKGYFSSKENRLKFIEWLKDKVGVSRVEDLNSTHYKQNHGGGLLEMFGGSPQGVLDSLRSDSDPKIFQASLKRSRVGQGFWSSLANQRYVLDSVGLKIGVNGSDLSPWYNLDERMLRKLGCRGILKMHEGSPFAMLRKVYPEHTWLPWKFRAIPRTISSDSSVILDLLKFIETERNLLKPEDWYRVSSTQLNLLGVHTLISQMGGLFNILNQYRPEFSWEEDRFFGAKQSGKKFLLAALKEIWPGQEILEDFALGPKVSFSFYLPGFQLAFDYQTDQDYGLLPGSGGTSNRVEFFEPTEKKALAEAKGITVVFVPFWWDRQIESLIATISKKASSLITARDDGSILSSENIMARPIPSSILLKSTTRR